MIPKASEPPPPDKKTTIPTAYIVGAIALLVVIVVGVFVLRQGTFATPPADPETTQQPAAADTPTPPLHPEEQLAWTAVQANADWTPYARDFDGVAMMLVPVGCFTMGSDAGYGDEKPPHEICFDEPFWIDKYGVTNAQYGAVGCERSSADPDQPRNCVNWFEARDFCENRDARLPTEAEWEYAARGPDSLVYPWGNTFVGDNVIHEGSPEYGDTSTAPIGSIPAGASWVGALDMSGNVWEWTSSAYELYPYDATDGREQDIGDNTGIMRVLRGGSFLVPSNLLRTTSRDRFDPSDSVSGDGFRCARSFE